MNSREYIESGILELYVFGKLSEDEKAHIINIGTSILCTKWDIGYPGGGFVQAFVDNDLMRAIGSADGISYKGFKFFAFLMYNVGMPVLN